VRNVAALNLGYFGIEFAVAIAIGSVALFADSVDFLEDGAVKYSDHCRAWILGGEARQTRYTALNAGAAHEVYLAARAEHVAAKPCVACAAKTSMGACDASLQLLPR
jgi:hypothetical protein